VAVANFGARFYDQYQGTFSRFFLLGDPQKLQVEGGKWDENEGHSWVGVEEEGVDACVILPSRSLSLPACLPACDLAAAAMLYEEVPVPIRSYIQIQ